MKTRRAWKQVESDWAERLGGKRVPITGRKGADVDHPRYTIEVKAGNVMSARLRQGMAQAVAASETTGKMPLLCISHSRLGRLGSEHFVMLRLEDFLAWSELHGR